jgi:hypothetical protein
VPNGRSDSCTAASSSGAGGRIGDAAGDGAGLAKS